MQQQPGPWQPPQPGWGPPQQPTPYVPQVPGAPSPSGEPDVSALDALKFLFKDENWQHNLLIGSVYVLIPIVGQLALLGWHCEIMQRLARKHARPIPKLEFSDLTHYLSRGITPFVMSLILSLPISLIVMAVMFVGMFGGGVLVAATGEPAVMIPIYIVVFLITWVVGLGIGVLMIGAMTRAELSEEVGYSLNFGAIFSYAGKVFWKALLANFVYGLLMGPIVMLGYAMCFVGLYPAMVIVGVGSIGLRSQIYQVYLARGGEPIQLKAPVALPSELQAQGFAQQQQYAQNQQPYPQGYQQQPGPPQGQYPGQGQGQPPQGGPFPGGWSGR
jgi:hypothetical protein